MQCSAVAGFADGGRGHEPRAVGGWWKLEKAGKRILPWGLQNYVAWQHLPLSEASLSCVTPCFSPSTSHSPWPTGPPACSPQVPGLQAGPGLAQFPAIGTLQFLQQCAFEMMLAPPTKRQICHCFFFLLKQQRALSTWSAWIRRAMAALLGARFQESGSRISRAVQVLPPAE